MTARRVVVGSRGSPLALRQAHLVCEALRVRWPGLECPVVVIRTMGDRAGETVTGSSGTKRVFTKELEDALLTGAIDLAVHSLKDLAVDLPAGLTVAAVLPREDPWDILLVRGEPCTLGDLPGGATVGTSSPRRRAQVLRARRDLRVVPLRGNIETRLRKLQQDGLDAIVLAAAGLRRLALVDRGAWVIPPEIMLPAPGQGMLGVQVRAEDRRVGELVGPLDDPSARHAIEAEWAVVAALGGGCRMPLGVLAETRGEELTIRARALTADGSQVAEASGHGRAREARLLGQRVAEQLRDGGAAGMLEAP